MKIIDQYVAKTVITTTLIVMLMILGLDLFFALVNEIRFVGTGNYSLTQILIHLALTAPRRVYTLFPMSCLLGSVLGLGVLAQHSELVAIRAAGVSVFNIIVKVLKIALIMSVLAFAIGEGVAPHANSLAVKLKTIAISGGKAVKTQYGPWLRDKDHFIHISEFRDKDYIKGITRYQINQEQKLTKASFASYGKYENNKWTLYNVKETTFNDNNTVTTAEMKTITWNSDIKPEVLAVIGQEHLERLSLPELWRTFKYRYDNDLDTQTYSLALWVKAMQPFAIIAMMFVAVPFVFGPLRSSTMGFRVLVGVLLGFGFFTLNAVFGPLALVYNLPAVVGATLPTLVITAFGIFMTRRVN